MVAFNVVGRLRQQNDLAAYRRKLSSEIGQDFMLRLLPALADLPLSIVGADGAPRGLSDAIRSAQRITLAGPSGSGRRLALQQWALRWAADKEPGAPAPVLLALPLIDDGVSLPQRLLTECMPAIESSPELRPARDTRPLFRRVAPAAAADERAPDYLLLIHGWEELAPERRELWRAALLAIAESSPTTRLAVALPPEEPPWPSYMPLRLAPISPELLAGWVERLAPAASHDLLQKALAPAGPLRALAGRLFEIALLAWLAPRAGLPKTRAGLYAEALASVVGLQGERLDAAPAVLELQLLAAYDERPAKLATELIVPGAGGALHFIHPQVRRYMAARQVVAEAQYGLLRQVDADERAELALLIATMIEDPGPLFAALWGQGELRVSDLLTLGRCLSERAPRSPSWALRVVAALAQLARAGAPAQREEARRLLDACMPALDTALPSAAGAGAPAHQFLIRLLGLLPDEQAARRMLQLVVDEAAAEPFVWTIADQLLARMASGEVALDPPSGAAALARWIYLQAMRPGAQRQSLDPALAVPALQALGASGAGETRMLQTAAALLEDLSQPPQTRLAALDLLAPIDQPAALTILERASDDPNTDIRRAALIGLNQHDLERAAVALGRASLDETAPWDLRLIAIQQLGDHIPRGAGQLLERCALDPALPLYARLQAVVALGCHSGGRQHLLQLFDSGEGHVEVRAAAARTLGAAGHADTAGDLLRLLESLRTDPAIVEGCCDGLGALRDREACGALLRLIDRPGQDVALTLAGLRALAQIADPASAEPISRLLGPGALQRLQHNLQPRLLQQRVDACVDDPALPRPIARRLALVLAASPTPESRPTTLAEFLAGEADHVQIGAAHALAAIGGNAARAALLAALLDDVAGDATAEVIAALADVEGPQSVEALGYLLDAQGHNPLTGWLVVRRLTEHPAGEALMLRALLRDDINVFTRGALAEGLGQRKALAALPALRQIADDHDADPHLRSQALLAIGLLADHSTETTLLRLIADPREEPSLRGLAAAQLPADLAADGRHQLRDVLRSERPPADLVIGALKALGRAHDREAVLLMLRYAQDEAPAVAQAAIAALTELGDGSIAPMLVRITQQPSADHALRLQAVGALLRIGGASYRPLLRTYLNQGALPYRLLALEQLIDAGTPADELLELLVSPGWPQALRLRLLDHFAGAAAAAPTLARILTAEDDDLQLRALAAEALGRLRWEQAGPTLIGLALRAQTPAALRQRCIAALHAIGGTDAWGAISRLAEDVAQPAEVRDSALRALRHADADESLR